MLSKLGHFLNSFLGMNRNLQVFCLANIVSGFGSGLLGGGLFVIFLRSLGIEMIELGIIGSIIAGLNWVLRPIAGRLSDQYGRKRLILIYSFGSLILPALALVAPHWMWLVPGWILNSLLGIISSPAYMAFMGDATDAKSRQTALASLDTLNSIPSLISPTLGGILADFWGIRALFVFELLFGAVSAFIIFGYIKDTVPSRVSQQVESGKKWQEKVHEHMLFIKNGLSLISKQGGRNLIAVIIIGCLWDIEAPAWDYLSIYFSEQLKIPYWFLGLITSIYTLSYMITQIPIGKIADKHGRKPFIFLEAVHATCVLSIAFIPNYYWLIPIYAIRAVSGMASGNAVVALMYDVIPPEVRGTLLGVIYGPIRSSTQVLGPIVSSYVWTQYGGLIVIYMISAIKYAKGLGGLIVQEKGLKRY
jgi:MFS family permease